MANYLTLLDKATNQPISLGSIDDRICKEVYHVEPHDKDWGSDVFDWYNTIGFQLSTGKSIEEVRQHYVTSDLWTEEIPIILPVIDFLENNYTPRASWR
jgi:hypothetical protein